jgi:Fusaric acid resistance protein-like
LGTGATAVQALSGSVAGFAVASAVMLTIGSDDRVLWVLLPVVVFLSAFTPGAVNFVVGQASFTVFVVVLFNILVPEGWRTGLVRVEDVAIGAGISVVVGALLWPRGARGVASRSFADLIRAERGHLVAAMGGACGRVPGPDVAEARAAAVGARGRAVAALEDLNVEHGGGRVERESWIRILGRATVVQIAGDGIQRAAATYGIASACTAAQGELDGGVERVARALDAEADQLAGTDALAAAPTAPATVATAPGLAECLDAHAHDIEPAMGLVWMHEYLMLVEDALAVNDLVAEGQVGETSEDARRG